MYICGTCGNQEGFIKMKVTNIVQECYYVEGFGANKIDKVETTEDITEVVVCEKCKGGDIIIDDSVKEVS